MSRIAPFTEAPLDLLVIGAGIHGAALADEASRAGLRVGLVDCGDYGAEASANSLKILHGGLRYLQQLNVPRMRDSIRSRHEAFLRFPHLARPARFLAPAGRGLKKSALAYRAAAVLNDLASIDRNTGLPASHLLPRTQVLGADELPHLPASAWRHGRSALCWHDGFIENSERLTLEYIRLARERGAVCANYVRATRLLGDEHRVTGARLRDERSGEEADVFARITVNAAGAWIPELRPANLPSPREACVRAWNLVVRRNWFGSDGVGLEGDPESAASRPRNFFFAPWREGTLIGTLYESFDPATQSCALQASDIERFVAEVNRIFPEADLHPSEVSFAHVGILPAKPNAGDEPASETRIADGRRNGVEGFLGLHGVKYTTAPIWARRLASLVLERLGRDRRVPASFSPATPPTAGEIRQAASQAGWTMPEETARWLERTYGPRYREVLALTTSPALQSTLANSVIPVAAVHHAVQREQALCLADFVFRRSDLGSFARPPAETLESTARAMAGPCAWDESRVRTELEAVEAHYLRLGLPPR